MAVHIKDNSSALLKLWAEVDRRPKAIIDGNLSKLWANPAFHQLLSQYENFHSMEPHFERSGPEVRAMLRQIQPHEPLWMNMRRATGEFITVRIYLLEGENENRVFGLSVNALYSTALEGRNAYLESCGITQAEQRIAGQLVLGRTAGSIAADLDVSINTVRTHIRNIYSKLQCNSREELFATLLIRGE